MSQYPCKEESFSGRIEVNEFDLKTIEKLGFILPKIPFLYKRGSLEDAFSPKKRDKAIREASNNLARSRLQRCLSCPNQKTNCPMEITDMSIAKTSNKHGFFQAEVDIEMSKK